MTNKGVPGSCFCGTVQFTIELPTLFCGHCHCSMCRRPHGAAFVTWTAVPPKQLKITAGEEQLTRFESGPPKGVRRFCSNCGSHLFCHVEEDVIDVAMAALHGVYVGNRRMFEDMNAAFSLNQIHPVVDQVFDFEDARAAYHAMRSAGHFGKLVVKV